jgi:predicted MFS family arabinose efflux permease
VTLLSAEAPGGSGTVMVLNGALTNLGAAGGGALGGILLAIGGYSTLGIGLGVIGVSTVMLLVRSTTLNPAPEPLGAA